MFWFTWVTDSEQTCNRGNQVFWFPYLERLGGSLTTLFDFGYVSFLVNATHNFFWLMRLITSKWTIEHQQKKYIKIIESISWKKDHPQDSWPIRKVSGQVRGGPVFLRLSGKLGSRSQHDWPGGKSHTLLWHSRSLGGFFDLSTLVFVAYIFFFLSFTFFFLEI